VGADAVLAQRFAVIALDRNGDHVPDLAEANVASSTVSRLLNPCAR